jgi:hypothetical protein
LGPKSAKIDVERLNLEITTTSPLDLSQSAATNAVVKNSKA